MLHNTERPARLYKYLPPDRVHVISDRMLRYTPLGAFNDPFEGRPDFTALAQEDHLKAVLSSVVADEALLQYNLLPQAVRNTIRKEDFLEWLSRLFQAKEADIVAQANKLAPMVRDRMAGKIDQQAGVLSLSEVPDSLLMWAHYAASHTGFVLEFDAHHPYFDERKSERDEFRHLRKVEYRNTRPSAPLNDIDGVDMFLVKSREWAYEREWRIIRAFAHADKMLPGHPHPTYLFNFPAKALLSVIIGARAAPETKSAIEALVGGVPHLAHVRVRLASPDVTSFRLNID